MTLLSLLGASSASAEPQKTGGAPPGSRRLEMQQRAQRADMHRHDANADNAYPHSSAPTRPTKKLCVAQYRWTRAAIVADGYTLLRRVDAIMRLVALYQRLSAAPRVSTHELA